MLKASEIGNANRILPLLREVEERAGERRRNQIARTVYQEPLSLALSPRCGARELKIPHVLNRATFLSSAIDQMASGKNYYVQCPPTPGSFVVFLNGRGCAWK